MFRANNTKTLAKGARGAFALFKTTDWLLVNPKSVQLNFFILQCARKAAILVTHKTFLRVL
ncbi:MAG TPA: hypothetical protein DCE56_38765 [Cyanobacteria bacterium UBA8553]|nr:hypothetical protein [Cyanobacteria bacterium UBA8553]